LPFSQNLKAHAFLDWSSLLVGFLTFVKDPRGVSLASHAIKEPLPHSFLTILLSIVMLPISLHLSLSLSSCFGSLVLEELGATLLLQPLPLVIKE
jgi:hypothetical protein